MSSQPVHLKEGITWCKYHCAVCDCCFRSLAAFDAHRRGSFFKNTRHCVDPERVKRKSDGAQMLELVEGRCRLGKDYPVVEAEIWRFPLEEEE